MAVVNHYKILGLPETATVKEISSAYRNLALKYHPDKNAGNAEALSRFHQIKEAYQLLTDVSAKAALDAVLAAQRQRQEREAQLSVERKQMRESLIHREQEARRRKAEEVEAEVRLQKEMERLRREAHAKDEERRANEEAERKFQEMLATKRQKLIDPNVPLYDDLDRTLKVTSISGQMLTEESLKALFGKVEAVVIGKKGTQAVVRLTSIDDSISWMEKAQKEGLSDVSLEWAKGKAPPTFPDSDKNKDKNKDKDKEKDKEKDKDKDKDKLTRKDFEEAILARMRQKGSSPKS